MPDAGGSQAAREQTRRVIPKLITQTWRTSALPDEAESFARGWRELNPPMEWRLFDDAACEALVAEVAPEHLDAYRAFPFPVMRADYFRYAAIYRDGGLYADVDMECVRPIAPLLASREAVLSVEATLTRRRQAELGYKRPQQVANCIFAARPRHPLLRAAMDRTVALAMRQPTIGRDDIEDISGPRMLTRLVYEQSWPGVTVLRQICLMPPRHYPDIWPFNVNVHARHHFFGGWKLPGHKTLARRLIERDRWPNPFPRDLADTSLSGAR